MIDRKGCAGRWAHCMPGLIALLACGPVAPAGVDKNDVLSVVAETLVQTDLRQAATTAAAEMNVRQEGAGWTVDGVVGAAEIVYGTLELSDADGKRRAEWILSTLEPIAEHALRGTMPAQDYAKNEAYRRAVLMTATLEQPKVEAVLEFGRAHDPDNAMYTLICARNAYRSYGFGTVRKLVRAFQDDPKPAYLCQRYSLARMAMALRTLDRLDKEAEIALVLAPTPPTDVGLCQEITGLLVMAQYSPVLLVERHPSEYPYPHPNNVGLFLALQMSKQPPTWRTFAPYVFLRLVSDATCGFQQFRRTADMGRSVSEAQSAWYKKLARTIDRQFEQAVADDHAFEELVKKGDREEIRKYIADPIEYMESRYEGDRRGEMAREWVALWKEWERLGSKD